MLRRFITFCFILPALALSGAIFLLYPTLIRFQKISAKLEQDLASVDPLLSCKGNGACLPSEILAVSGSVRYTLGTVARAMPQLTSSAKKAADNSARASQETANAALLLKPILLKADGALGEVKESAAALHETVADLRGVIPSLAKDSDSAIKSAGTTLDQFTSLEKDVQEKLDNGSPEAYRIAQSMQKVLDDPNLKATIGNVNNATASGSHILDTVDKAIATRRKGLLSWLFAKLF